MSVTADNQHCMPRLKHKIARKWERTIKYRAATRERRRYAVIDSAENSSFW